MHTSSRAVPAYSSALHRDTKWPHVRMLFVLRGVMFLVFGGLAVRWPEELMMNALLFVALTATVSGVLELVQGTRMPALPSTRYFVVAHAVAVIFFGVWLIILPFLDEATGRYMAALWLGVYAAGLMAVAGRVWFAPLPRYAALAAAGFTSACALLVGTSVQETEPLLYETAGFAALWGMAHLVVASWIKRWRVATNQA